MQNLQTRRRNRAARAYKAARALKALKKLEMMLECYDETSCDEEEQWRAEIGADGEIHWSKLEAETVFPAPYFQIDDYAAIIREFEAVLPYVEAVLKNSKR